MATEKKAVTLSNFGSKFVVTNATRRIVKTLLLDNNNIQISFNQGTEVYDDFVKREQAIYDEREALYEAVLKGEKELPANREYPALNVTEDMDTYGVRCFFYIPAHHLREAKKALSAAFGLEGHPHGSYTTVKGLLQFGVSNATPNEVHKFMSLYAWLFEGLPADIEPYYLPEPVQRAKGSKSKTVKSTTAPKSKKPAIVIHENEKANPDRGGTVTTSKATPEQLELAKKIKEANNR